MGEPILFRPRFAGTETDMSPSEAHEIREAPADRAGPRDDNQMEQTTEAGTADKAVAELGGRL